MRNVTSRLRQALFPLGPDVGLSMSERGTGWHG